MRYIAHVIIEAKTPLKIGSKDSSFFQDAPVLKDFNNLPFIQGTSIAGVIRKEVSDDTIFGYQDKEEGEGSKVIFSNALLLDENGKVNEELLLEKSEFLKKFDNLPIRNHTAITKKGVSKKHSKFDEEVVFKGSRFKFSIEVINEREIFEEILAILYRSDFRLGGGSTKGFGEIEVIDIKVATYDEKDYLNYSSSLNYELKDYVKYDKCNNFVEYKLKLTPDDFFIFGSGYGTKQADLAPMFEEIVDYEKKEFIKKALIPASSIKGAIAHRFRFYLNKEAGNVIGKKIKDIENDFEEVFGSKKDKDKIAKRGKVLFSDIFLDSFKTKIFDHVKIDRFTGGAIDGALFQEESVNSNEFELKILWKLENKKLQNIFEMVLKDIANGMLALGGMSAKGYGFFSGKIFRNGEEI